MSMLPKSVFFAAACAAFLTGCTMKIDGSQIEDNIKTNMKSQTGTEMKSVSCPKEIEVKSGATFDCKAAATTGEDLVIGVTLTDGTGKFEWKVKTVNGKAPAATSSAAPTASAAAPAASE